jgi:hypothetical protein
LQQVDQLMMPPSPTASYLLCIMLSGFEPA